MKLSAFQLEVLATIATLLRDGRDGVGPTDVMRALPDPPLPPNRFNRAMEILVEQGMLVRRTTSPRAVTALTPAGQAALDAATAAEPARP